MTDVETIRHIFPTETYKIEIMPIQPWLQRNVDDVRTYVMQNNQVIEVTFTTKSLADDRDIGCHTPSETSLK